MSISYIGSTLSLVSGTPATEDQAGYELLTFVEVGKVVSVGEVRDSSEDINFNLLKSGRTTHVNGAKDMGEIEVVIEYDSADAGYALLVAANNGNTSHSFRIQDTDSNDRYFYGLVANLGDPAREASAYKGKLFTIRPQSGVTDVQA